ncbi:phosphate acetyltransferase [Microbulbifer halophilus]|uniref:Phosphate acetyltransferase n=1 Tax=Microbulbifer halophilus TaxID=453963 RepID=A0ABW5ECF0_9GAMM|nr:phosphate acetyltransferase [Microbulbifer halophilus]MCW8127213.1 phosphate acetyltransferase [Microbulbifer halophilus]
MSRTIMLVPLSSRVGITSISLGIIRALERNGVGVNFFKPVTEAPATDGGTERSTEILRRASSLEILESLSAQHAESMISTGKLAELLEEILAHYREGTANADVMIVEGILPDADSQFANQLNYQIAKTLDAEIVFAISPHRDSTQQLKERLEFATAIFGGRDSNHVVGCIINKVGAPTQMPEAPGADITGVFEQVGGHRSELDILSLYGKSPLRIVGCVPWNAELLAPRAVDLARHFDAEIINRGDLEHRRLHSITFCSRSLGNMIYRFVPGAMLVTSGDRPDVIVAACLAAMNGVKIGCLLLTGGYHLEPMVRRLCTPALETGLPVLLIDNNTWQTALQLQHFNTRTPTDDLERIDRVQDFIAGHLDHQWVQSLSMESSRPKRLSPPAFRYHLAEQARKANKRIVLPEGDEPRTVRAALICAERGIARPVLLGSAGNIHRVAEQQGVRLGDKVEIVEPDSVREKYVEPMVALRRGKGLTEVVAREQLQDNVVLGTMMLAQGEVDGLVSGAVHTTANTIRPALQLIKTAPGAKLVSSIFFMLLPEQVLVYGDCAINPDPNAEELADIAIQSADSAEAFGIEPRVAMISYSTGSSGSGTDVEKVREATKLAREKRPDLAIDGPLQYDAAVMENVAETKAPDSPVAGRATVFIFPDLNTGNTTYKAVQRSAELVSIGPMLQGMRKPVNDLSRGALVDDIVYTIALTAIQAGQS